MSMDFHWAVELPAPRTTLQMKVHLLHLHIPRKIWHNIPLFLLDESSIHCLSLKPSETLCLSLSKFYPSVFVNWIVDSIDLQQLVYFFLPSWHILPER